MHTHAINRRLQIDINEPLVVEIKRGFDQREINEPQCIEINFSLNQEEQDQQISYQSISPRDGSLRLRPQSIRSICPEEAKAINPVDIARTVDLSYRRTAGRIPLFGSLFPTIPSLLIFLVLCAYPPLGVLLFACNFLNKASGGAVPSPEKLINSGYRSMLIQANPGEQKQQAQLIPRNKGELITMGLHRLPVLSEVCFVADTLTDTVSGLKTNTRLPSLSSTLTDKINEVLPQNIDFSALNTRGNCFGLVMVRFAAKKVGMQKLFYQTLNSAMSKAQSLLNTKLSEAERQLVKVISDVQNKQEKEIMIPCLGRQDTFVSIKEKVNEIFGIYEGSERFDEMLYGIIQTLIESVAPYPGELATFTISKRDSGHIIGIMAEQDEDGIKIEIDDPNFPMAPFRNIEEAAKAFKYLLCSEYEDYFRPNPGYANIEIQGYQTEVLEVQPQNRMHEGLEMQPQTSMAVTRFRSEVPRSLLTNTDRYVLLGREWFSFVSAFAMRHQQRQEASPDENKAVVRFTG